MPRIYLDCNLQTVSPESLTSEIQRIFQQLEDQVNSGPASVALTNPKDKLPQGMAAGDPVFALINGVMTIGIFDGQNVQFQTFNIATITTAGFMSADDKIKLNSYKGQTSSLLPPALADLPTAGDFSFHHDTNAGTFYIASNFAGTIKSALLT